MADGDWMDVPTAAEILASWFARAFAGAEVAEIVRRLTSEGLVRCRSPLALVDGDIQRCQPQDHEIEFTATAAGSEYLRSTIG